MRGSTTARGYGAAHQAARKRALTDMQDGQPCTRCGQPMWTEQAKYLDLDHAPGKRGYRGLAHRRCNRAAGQAVGAQRKQAMMQQSLSAHSRAW